jgi:hypothetical protein
MDVFLLTHDEYRFTIGGTSGPGERLVTRSRRRIRENTRGETMAERTCYNCVYACIDPGRWMRCEITGEPMLVQCANHPYWPGVLHDVPGVPCRNYRPKPTVPQKGVRMIPISDGGYAYVSECDYAWLSRYNWQDHNGYAARKVKGKLVLMHREIVQPPEGKVVDHKDGNKRNNCRDNLRACTHDENRWNNRKQAKSDSVFKGVYFNKRSGKWMPRCRFGGRHPSLGLYEDEAEAARAYDHRAVECFGEFARVNFPKEWPPERRAEVYAQAEAVRKKAKKKQSKRTTKKNPRAEPQGRSEKKAAAGSKRKAGQERKAATAGGASRKARAKTSDPDTKSPNARDTSHEIRDTAPKAPKKGKK